MNETILSGHLTPSLGRQRLIRFLEIHIALFARLSYIFTCSDHVPKAGLGLSLSAGKVVDRLW